MEEMKRRNIEVSAYKRPRIENAKVEKLVPGGDGLIRHEGKVVFIPSVLPDEIVDVEITEQKRSFSRGICTSIHTPSVDRIAPRCPYYNVCGGCNLQHLDYPKQLEYKRGFVQELFYKFAGIDLDDDFEFIPSKPFAYRNRVQIHCDGHTIGFKGRSSDAVIAIDHCPILVDSLNQFLKEAELLEYNHRLNLFGLDDRVYPADTKEDITLDILEKSVSFRSDMFFQSNLFLLPELIEFALADLKGQKAMDLYCGTGLFSVFLKERFSEITAIEINPDVEEYYCKNMEGSSFDFYGLSLENWLKRGFHKNRGSMDLIVVDPPRIGLSKSVQDFLCEKPVPRLVYISCDPATQARDTARLLSSGYMIESIKGFDFYPQTNHMETVIRFIR